MTVAVHIYHQNLLNYAAGRRQVILEQSLEKLSNLNSIIYSVAGFTEIVGNKSGAMSSRLSPLLRLSKSLNEEIKKCRAVEVGQTALGKHGEYISIAWDESIFTAENIGRATILGEPRKFWNIEDRLAGGADSELFSFTKDSQYALDQRGVAFISGYIEKTEIYPIYFHDDEKNDDESVLNFKGKPFLCDRIKGGRALTGEAQFEIIRRKGKNFGFPIRNDDILFADDNLSIRGSACGGILRDPKNADIVTYAGKAINAKNIPVCLSPMKNSNAHYLHVNGRLLYKTVTRKFPMVIGFIHNVYNVSYPSTVFENMGKLISLFASNEKHKGHEVIIGGDYNIQARDMDSRKILSRKVALRGEGMHLRAAVAPKAAPATITPAGGVKIDPPKNDGVMLIDKKITIGDLLGKRKKQMEVNQLEEYIKTTNVHTYDYWIISTLNYDNEAAHVWKETRRADRGDGLSDHAGISLCLGETI